MRAIHKVRIGGTPRHPSIQEQLFVGSNPRGSRDGLSGSPVDAVLVATGVACNSKMLAALSDDQLVRLSRVTGPIDGLREKVMRFEGMQNPLVAEVWLIKIERDHHANL